MLHPLARRAKLARPEEVRLARIAQEAVDHAGIRRHAMLAREFGASWDEVLGSIMLTTPGFGLLPAVEALTPAREGFDAAPEVESDE